MTNYVDLEQYSDFTTGSLGAPPYTLQQYEDAKNNLIVLQDIIDDSKNQGYSKVIFKKTEFSICYTGAPIAEIMLEGDTVYDFSGSVIDVIYDSENRSPYDTSSNQIFNFRGRCISFKDSHNNIKLFNLHLKGDIFNRSFVDDNEKRMEQTTGITLGYCTNNIEINNCTIEGFMGDGIWGITGAGNTLFPTESGRTYVLSSWGGTYYKGVFNPSINTITSSNHNFVSNLTPIQYGRFENNSGKYSDFVYIRRQGGYNRTNITKHKTIKVHFFDENQVYISSVLTSYMNYFPLDRRARFLRVQIYGEESQTEIFTESGQNFLCMAFNQDFVIDNCIIKNNHRGGVSNCADDLTIKNTKIYSNGLDSGIGAPLFPDTTRYGINIEDVYGRKLVIENSYIRNNGNIDIGYGGMQLHIHKNCELANVHIFSCENVVVEDSTFISPSLAPISFRTDFNPSVGMCSVILRNNFINCEGKIIDNSNTNNDKIKFIYDNNICNIDAKIAVNISGNSVHFVNNTLNIKRSSGSYGNIAVGNLGKFEGNTIKVLKDYSQAYLLVILSAEKIGKGNIFNCATLLSQGTNTQTIEGCTFENILETAPVNTTISRITSKNETQFFNTVFYNCFFKNGNVTLKGVSSTIEEDVYNNFIFKDCYFTNTEGGYSNFYKVGNSNTSGKEKTTFKFENCIFDTPPDNIIINKYGNSVNNGVKIQLKSCLKARNTNIKLTKENIF